jgi:hypothetical protein
MDRHSITPSIIEAWKGDAAGMQEKQLRQFAARRAIELGYGGIAFVSEALGINRKTIKLGIEEIKADDLHKIHGRIRKDGGGRNSVSDNFALHIAELNRKNGWNLGDNFYKSVDFIMTDYAYGDASARGVFTRAKPNMLVEIFQDKYGFKTSEATFRRVLEELGYSLQRNQKLEQVGAQHPKRNDQFEYRKTLMQETLKNDLPLLSIDTKAKVKVGLFASNGREWRKVGDPRKAFDHDFPFKFKDIYPEGFHDFTEELMNRYAVACPNGVYCLNNNQAYVSVGMDHDTAEFAANTLRQWYSRMGKTQFPNAKVLVILCDGGGSNRAIGYTWKLEIAKLVRELKLDYIQIFHHPPGTSKWDPIEHRLWSVISIHWMGQLLDSFETIRGFIESTTTKTGLKVLCDLDYGVYPTEQMKKKAAKLNNIDQVELDAQVQFERIAKLEYFHEDPDLRKWNYIIRSA